MTIDSAFISCFKDAVPAAFTPEVPFIPEAVFIDRQIKLMGPQHDGVQTWEEYVDRQFTYNINRLFSKGVTCVILAFDDYSHVPASKSMTQILRRRHIPFVEVHEEDSLPPVVPVGERWSQLMANRTFKTKLIQMIVGCIPHRVRMRQDFQSLIVDFQGHPVRYNWEGQMAEVLTQFDDPIGEADAKAKRYTSLYNKLQTNSVDGDTVLIMLLHYEQGFQGNISVCRMKTNNGVRRKLNTTGGEPPPKPPSRRREYEYVDIGRLYFCLKRMLAPPCSYFLKLPAGHEISMLMILIGLAGTDYTRGLPQLSGKSMFESIPAVWAKIASSYDTERGLFDLDKAINNVVAMLYHIRFEKHVASYSISKVLSEISGSNLSDSTNAIIPKDPSVFHCTIHNINWLLLYWRGAGTFPDPIDPAFGYVRTHTGAVAFAA